jgi:hypothetical protein
MTVIATMGRSSLIDFKAIVGSASPENLFQQGWQGWVYPSKKIPTDEKNKLPITQPRKSRDRSEPLHRGGKLIPVPAFTVMGGASGLKSHSGTQHRRFRCAA